MFLFIGDVTSVQCITSVLNNTKAGRLLSSASVEFSCGSLGWSARLVRPSGKSPIPANVGYPDLPSFGSQPFHCQLQKTQKILIFKPNFKSIFGTQKIIENWIKIEDLDKKNQKLKIWTKKTKNWKLEEKNWRLKKIWKTVKNSSKIQKFEEKSEFRGHSTQEKATRIVSASDYTPHIHQRAFCSCRFFDIWSSEQRSPLSPGSP